MHEHRQTVDETAELIDSAARPPLITVTGPAGAGRSTLLTGLRQALTERGVRTIVVRAAPTSPFLTQLPMYEPNPALPGTGRFVPGAAPANPGWSLVSSITGMQFGPPVARRAAIRVPVPAPDAGPVALLIDDAQWIDVGSLEALVRQLAGTPVTCVCTVRLPLPPTAAPEGRAALARLRKLGLVREIALRPLSERAITALVVARIGGRPDADLLRRLRRYSHGVPGPLVAAIEAYQQADSFRVFDRRAYLVTPDRPPTLPEDHELLLPIRRLGDPVWPVAKAAAVLAPLGAALPGLAAQALGLPEATVRRALDTLRAQGVLHAGRGWRFVLPLLVPALAGCLGPYERRRLAELAVTALWEGTADCADPDYLPDQLAIAGKLVDPRRAGAELTARAAAIMLDDGERAARWLRTAAGLTPDRAQRAVILLMHSAACYLHNAYERSVESSDIVLRDHADQLTDDALLEMLVRRAIARHCLGDTTALDDMIAEDDRAERSAPWIVARASALAVANRWAEAGRLLAARREQWRTSELGGYLGSHLELHIALFLGRRETFEQRFAESLRQLHHDERYRFEEVGGLVLLLLIAGDLDRAERLLARQSIAVERMRPANRALLAMQRGEFRTATELAGRAVATGGALGHDPADVAMYQAAALMLLAHGKLSRAQELLARGRAARPVLPHLLDLPDAMVHRALGDTEQAGQKLLDGLQFAAQHEVVLDTELLWGELVELALTAGRPEQARQYLVQVEQVAARLGTGRSELAALAARAEVAHDRAAAMAALRLARRRAQPWELARLIDRLVRFGVGDPAWLGEGYELLGGLDALLHRAWMRNLMREHDIAVPGRRTTVAESERLLAVLVAEGLGNRQLATVLQASEKSVEGRLSRLFSRTGYRSRIELAAAMLKGEYAG